MRELGTYQKRKQLNLCVGCGKESPLTPRVRCQKCLDYSKTKAREWFNRRTPEELKEYYSKAKLYMSNINNRDKWNNGERSRNFALKVETITAYGGECVCCHEKEVKFLTLDHIAEDGNKHRTQLKVKAGVHFYAKLRNMGYPDCGLQVMCANCHGAKSKYGVCPHQTIV